MRLKLLIVDLEDSFLSEVKKDSNKASAIGKQLEDMEVLDGPLFVPLACIHNGKLSWLTYAYVTPRQEKFNEVSKILSIEITQEVVKFPPLYVTACPTNSFGRPPFKNLQEHVEWKIKEAYKVLHSPCVLDSAEIDVEESPDVFVPQPFSKEDLEEFVNKFQKRRAIARVLVGYTENGEDVHFFQGSLEGTIRMPRGPRGFGWDAIFYPKGYLYTLAGYYSLSSF